MNSRIGTDRLFAPGQTVTLYAQSTLYRKPYKIEVIDAGNGILRTSMPMDGGILVLLAAGTPVVLEYGEERMQGTVINRLSGPEKALVVRVGERYRRQKHSRVIAVSSGKGGVGKTTLSVNLAISLAQQAEKVCLVDADLGTANVDVLLNISPQFNAGHVARGEKNIFEVLVEGPYGLVMLPGGSGLQELARLEDAELNRLLAELRLLEEYFDVILIDTGAGLSDAVIRFLRAADQGIIVTTPEPHALTDAYALMKVLATEQGARPELGVVVNRVRSRREGERVANRVKFAAGRFLGMEINIFGTVAEDEKVGEAIRRQSDFVGRYPKCQASRDVRKIASMVSAGKRENGNKERVGFWKRLLGAARTGSS